MKSKFSYIIFTLLSIEKENLLIQNSIIRTFACGMIEK